MRKSLPLIEIQALVGTEIGQSDWLHIDQERVDRFADCTDDHQWIHVDTARAATGPFGATIAHGFLTLSLIPYLSRSVFLQPEDTIMAVNYGFETVRLINPVSVGAKIRDTLSLTAVKVKDQHRVLMTTRHTIEIESRAKPACVAECLSMYFLSTPVGPITAS